MTSDWKYTKYEAGTEVHVVDLEDEYLGVGVLIYDFDAGDDDNPMPEIRLVDGTLILGCDCFWIPLEETKEINKKVAEQQRKRVVE